MWIIPRMKRIVPMKLPNQPRFAYMNATPRVMSGAILSATITKTILTNRFILSDF